MVLAVCWHARAATVGIWGIVAARHVMLDTEEDKKKPQMNPIWLFIAAYAPWTWYLQYIYSKRDLVMAVHCFSILHPKVVFFWWRAFHMGPICVSSCLGVWEKIRSQDIDLCKLWICTHSLWYPPCDYWHSWRYARHLWVFAWPSSISTMRSSAVCSSCQSSRSSSRPCTEMPWLLNHLPSPNSLDAKLWPPLDL